MSNISSEVLLAFVKRWRTRRVYNTDPSYDDGFMAGLEACADELEAEVVATTPFVQVDEARQYVQVGEVFVDKYRNGEWMLGWTVEDPDDYPPGTPVFALTPNSASAKCVVARSTGTAADSGSAANTPATTAPLARRMKTMINTETLRALVDAGNRLDSAMDMQEQRERGTFHLSQQAAAGVWKDARRLWAEAVEQALSATDGVSVFTNDGNEEQRFIEHESLSCPHCGGSGHRDDVAAAPAVEVDEAVARDADRYRFLRNHANEVGSMSPAVILATEYFAVDSEETEGFVFGEDLDRAVDSALTAALGREDARS